MSDLDESGNCRSAEDFYCDGCDGGKNEAFIDSGVEHNNNFLVDSNSAGGLLGKHLVVQGNQKTKTYQFQDLGVSMEDMSEQTETGPSSIGSFTLPSLLDLQSRLVGNSASAEDIVYVTKVAHVYRCWLKEALKKRGTDDSTAAVNTADKEATLLKVENGERLLSVGKTCQEAYELLTLQIAMLGSLFERPEFKEVDVSVKAVVTACIKNLETLQPYVDMSAPISQLSPHHQTGSTSTHTTKGSTSPSVSRGGYLQNVIVSMDSDVTPSGSNTVASSDFSIDINSSSNSRLTKDSLQYSSSGSCLHCGRQSTISSNNLSDGTFTNVMNTDSNSGNVLHSSRMRPSPPPDCKTNPITSVNCDQTAYQFEPLCDSNRVETTESNSSQLVLLRIIPSTKQGKLMKGHGKINKCNVEMFNGNDNKLLDGTLSEGLISDGLYNRKIYPKQKVYSSDDQFRLVSGSQPGVRKVFDRMSNTTSSFVVRKSLQGVGGNTSSNGKIIMMDEDKKEGIRTTNVPISTPQAKRYSPSSSKGQLQLLQDFSSVKGPKSAFSSGTQTPIVGGTNKLAFPGLDSWGLKSPLFLSNLSDKGESLQIYAGSAQKSKNRWCC